jgi:hypothetical protein
MSLLDTAGSVAVWWKVILPFAIFAAIFALIGIHILNTPRKVGYKVTTGTVKSVQITQSAPRTTKNSSRIYYDYNYSMTVQCTN